jgi:hypothetical protein
LPNVRKPLPCLYIARFAGRQVCPPLFMPFGCTHLAQGSLHITFGTCCHVSYFAPLCIILAHYAVALG